MEPIMVGIGAAIAKIAATKAIGLAFSQVRDRISSRTDDRVAQLAFEGAWDLHFSWLEGIHPQVKSFIILASQTQTFEFEATQIAQGYPTSRDFGFERVWAELVARNVAEEHDPIADSNYVDHIAKVDARLHYVGFLSAIERHTYEALQLRNRNREHSHIVAEMKNVERSANETLSTIKGLFIFAVVFVVAKQSLETALPMFTHLHDTGFLDEVGAASAAGLVGLVRHIVGVFARPHVVEIEPIRPREPLRFNKISA